MDENCRTKRSLRIFRVRRDRVDDGHWWSVTPEGEIIVARINILSMV
jgi:hypothetical protein